MGLLGPTVVVSNTTQALAVGGTVLTEVQTYQTLGVPLSVAGVPTGLTVADVSAEVEAHNAVMLAMVSGLVEQVAITSTTTKALTGSLDNPTFGFASWNALATAFNQSKLEGGSLAPFSNFNLGSVQNALGWVDAWALESGLSQNPILPGGALAAEDAGRASFGGNFLTGFVSATLGIEENLPFIGTVAKQVDLSTGASAGIAALNNSASASAAQLSALQKAGNPIVGPTGTPLSGSMTSNNLLLLGAAGLLLLLVVL